MFGGSGEIINPHARRALALSLDLPEPFGYRLADVVDKVVTSRFDVVELWSGVGSVARAAKAKSQNAATFDKTDSQSKTF